MSGSIVLKVLAVANSCGVASIIRKRAAMKTLIASVIALTLLGAGAAAARPIVGVHVGGVGIGIGAHGHHYHHHYRHHYHRHY